ncbi:MAG TPA: glycosyltransferase family 4 protein, partial [Salinimicrobium sp.]|nr:glycosyltransferase family 4 protein [Salinimicrobium sp.]
NLSQKLKETGFVVITASHKQSKALRLTDMLLTVLQKGKNSDVVLVDTYSTSNFWYAYAVAFLCRKLSLKYIPILHGGNLPQRLKNSPKASKAIFENAYVNVAPSSYLKKAFQNAGYKNVEYIPNHIELESYPFKERKTIRPRLLWVRAFAEIYNPLLAIKVLEHLLKEYSTAHLCMVGPKKDASWEKCRDYAQNKKLPVSFTGRLNKEDWHKKAEEYDIFINTTTIDNSPMSVIEAMALGLPVISTNVGGIPYLIENGKDGVLVPPNDVKSMKNELVILLENPVLSNELTINARKKVEKFDWKDVKKQWMDLLIRI